MGIKTKGWQHVIDLRSLPAYCKSGIAAQRWAPKSKVGNMLMILVRCQPTVNLALLPRGGHQKKQSKVGNTVMILVSCLNKYFTVGHRWAPIPKVGYTLMRVVRCQPKSVIAFERWTPKPKVGNTLTILVSC